MNLKYVFCIIMSVLFCTNTLALEESTEVRSLLRTRVQDKLEVRGIGKMFKKLFSGASEVFSLGVKGLKSLGKKSKRSPSEQSGFERRLKETANEITYNFQKIGVGFGEGIGAAFDAILDSQTAPVTSGSLGCSSAIVNAFCDNTDCDPCNAVGVASAELISRTILTGIFKRSGGGKSSIVYAAQCTATFGRQCAEKQGDTIPNQYAETTIKENDCIHMAVAEYGGKVVSKRKGLIAGSWGHVPRGCSVQSKGDWAAHFNRGSGSSSSYTPVNFDSTVITEEDCMLSALIMYGEKVTASRNKLQVGHWSKVPVGCSVQSGGDWAVHFNKRAGSNNGGYTSLSRKPTELTEIEENPDAIGELVWDTSLLIVEEE